jgi:hypothetical protein
MCIRWIDIENHSWTIRGWLRGRLGVASIYPFGKCLQIRYAAIAERAEIFKADLGWDFQVDISPVFKCCPC